MAAIKAWTVQAVTIKPEQGTDRGLYVTWSFKEGTKKKGKTELHPTKSKVVWSYRTENDNQWFVAQTNEIEYNTYIDKYTAPENAVNVRVVITPVPPKHKVKKKTVDWWTPKASTAVYYAISNLVPEKPSAPTTTLTDFKLTSSVSIGADSRTTAVEFEVVKDNTTVFASSGQIPVNYQQATFTCTIAAGGKYKVRCRAWRGGVSSLQWSDYSSEVSTQPTAPNGISSCKALSSTSVQITWPSVTDVTGYEVQYAEQADYFDSSSNVQSSTVTNPMAIITGIDSGKTWWFRVRATNSTGNSAWTQPVSITLGKVPSAPTTWSSTSTAITGEKIIFYWVHNSEDGSSQTYAELELSINGNSQIIQIKNTEDEDHKDDTSRYEFNTSGYGEGAKILWRVRTRGILSEYSPWSAQRSIDIYAQPSLQMILNASTLTIFPLNIKLAAYPATQTPTGYYISVVSTETYETVNDLGETEWISENQEVFSKNYDVKDRALNVSLSAGDVNLDNNITYRIVATVSMNSGLTAEATAEFTVAWTDAVYDPIANVTVDEDTYTAVINPFVQNDDETFPQDVTLSVYRREFDGTFTELATDLVNSGDINVTDPHPALNYTRYRIVAKSTRTGGTSFYDIVGDSFDDVGVIIQWDEQWSNFMSIEEDDALTPKWSGSLLKLPYNIEISAEHAPDVELVEYIGRKHPVSYYGTQKGETATWNVAIDAEDEDTLYAIRRLAAWSGDAYVREPSGIGYWANVTVSYSKKYNDLTIPVTFTIKRVEGGA